MCSPQTSSGPVWPQDQLGTFPGLYWIQDLKDLSKKGLQWHLSSKVQCWYCLHLPLHRISWSCCRFSWLLILFVFRGFFLSWLSVWQETFGEREVWHAVWHADMQYVVCTLIIRRLWRPLYFLYSDSCSVVTPECPHAGIILLPDSSLKPSLTETELLLDYPSGHQHDMYVSQDTTLVLLQALDISRLDHSHLTSFFRWASLSNWSKMQQPFRFSPKRPTATLPTLASCSGLHQIQVPDVTLQRLCWHLSTSQVMVKPFHSSKNSQIYCLPGALLSWRSSQTCGNTVLCSYSHLHWIPAEIRAAETCTSSNKPKIYLLKREISRKTDR